MTTPSPTMPARRAARPVTTLRYSIYGVAIGVTSDVEAALAIVDGTYGAFRSRTGRSGRTIELLGAGPEGPFAVAGPGGAPRPCPSLEQAVLAVLDLVTGLVLERLRRRGLLAVHAGTVTRPGRALVVAGRSGQGKTTLVLGLARRGLGLLSDELAVIDPRSRRVLPYRRGVHVRPGTLALVPELALLRDRPPQEIGGGEWSISHEELGSLLPGGLGAPAPLAAVLVLAGGPGGGDGVVTPISPALAAMELMRGTPAASADARGTLARLARVLGRARCARLEAGDLEPTLDRVVAWLDEDRDG